MRRLILATVIILLAALFGPALLLRPEAPPAVWETPVPAGRADRELRFSVSGENGIFQTDMAEHLPNAVAAEMPASFHEQALMAQAVALRSYILSCAEHPNPRHPGAAVCTDPACCKAWLSDAALREKWGEAYTENMQRIRRAVSATDGQYLSYENAPILAVFHASSGGKTESSGGIWNPLPYLPSVDSPETEENVEDLVTEVCLTPDGLLAGLRRLYPDAMPTGDVQSWLGECVPTESGRVKTLTVCGRTLTGTEARACFDLKSTDFDAAYTQRGFVFTVRGYGHGVGMSQQGAQLLAEQGMDYREILAHYYPGTQLTEP